jgi:hypothetical protein
MLMITDRGAEKSNSHGVSDSITTRSNDSESIFVTNSFPSYWASSLTIQQKAASARPIFESFNIADGMQPIGSRELMPGNKN